MFQVVKGTAAAWCGPLLLFALLSGCGGKKAMNGNTEAIPGAEADADPSGVFENIDEIGGSDFVSADTVQQINASIPTEYRLGPGDVVDIQVWDHPELSGQHTVGPDGNLALPLIGEQVVEGLTRTEASNLVREQLATFYKEPFVNFQVLEYHNNRVFVLGRVLHPGLVAFKGRGTLLEALSVAGSIPVLDETTQLTKCAVIRGKDQIIWINLKELLVHGNVNLNLHLVNNDVIFIPDGHDTLVYVMGEVRSPGAFRISTSLSFLDALMLAGGITEDANRYRIRLIRNVKGEAHVLEIDLNEFRKGDFTHNMLLAENDIVYVPRRGLAKFGYVLNKLNPFAQWFLVKEAIEND